MESGTSQQMGFLQGTLSAFNQSVTGKQQYFQAEQGDLFFGRSHGAPNSARVEPKQGHFTAARPSNASSGKTRPSRAGPKYGHMGTTYKRKLYYNRPQSSKARKHKRVFVDEHEVLLFPSLLWNIFFPHRTSSCFTTTCLIAS